MCSSSYWRIVALGYVGVIQSEIVLHSYCLKEYS